MTLIEQRADVPQGDEQEIRRRLREELPEDTFTPKRWRYAWFLVHQLVFWGGVVFICTQRPALWLCAVVSLAMVVGVGTASGRSAIDAALGVAGLPGLPWDSTLGGFETLVAGSAPVFWAFFLLTGISVIVLRIKDGKRPRPFA